MPCYVQSDRTYCVIQFVPVRGIKIRATVRNHILFAVTSAIAYSADNLDNLFNTGTCAYAGSLKINSA